MVASPSARAFAVGVGVLLACLTGGALDAAESVSGSSESQAVPPEVRFELEVIRPGVTAVSIFRGVYADWILFVRFGDENSEGTLALETDGESRAVVSLGESRIVLEPTLQRIRIAGLPVSRQEGAVILVSGWPEKQRPRVRGIGRISSSAERAPKPAAELYQNSVDLRGKIHYMR